MKGSAFFKQNSRFCERYVYFQFFGFTDDLCTFNNNKFENNCHDIYPNELEIKNKKEDCCKASILKLSIEVYKRKFTTKLFDEGYTSPFCSNQKPYLDLI